MGLAAAVRACRSAVHHQRRSPWKRSGSVRTWIPLAVADGNSGPSAAKSGNGGTPREDKVFVPTTASDIAARAGSGLGAHLKKVFQATFDTPTELWILNGVAACNFESTNYAL